jgi:Mce-associated membrane protein
MTEEQGVPPRVPDEPGQPAEPEQVQPAWAEPPASPEESAEDEYDAWLDAQDHAQYAPSRETGDAAGVPAESVAAQPDVPADEPVSAPVVVPDALEAAATPLEVTPEPEAHATEALADEPALPEPSAVEPAAVEPEPVPAASELLPEDPEAPAAAVPTAEPELPTGALPEHDEPVAALAEPAPAVPGTRPATWLVVPLAVLVALLAALTAVLGVASVRTRGGGGVEQARHDGLQAARDAARVVFSYDYRHLKKDFAAGKAVTTGAFAADYQRTTSRLVDDVAVRYKAVVVADVSDAAVISADRSEVVVLLFVNQRSTSSLNAGSKITTNRLTMTMVRVGGRWKAAQVKAF